MVEYGGIWWNISHIPNPSMLLHGAGEARRAHNPEVDGSKPSGVNKKNVLFLILMFPKRIQACCTTGNVEDDVTEEVGCAEPMCRGASVTCIRRTKDGAQPGIVIEVDFF